MTRNYK